MSITWKGNKLKEKAYLDKKPIIEIVPKYFRPSEVDSLKGSINKAKKLLKWKPSHNIHSLIKNMIEKNIND